MLWGIRWPKIFCCCGLCERQSLAFSCGKEEQEREGWWAWHPPGCAWKGSVPQCARLVVTRMQHHIPSFEIRHQSTNFTWWSEPVGEWWGLGEWQRGRRGVLVERGGRFCVGAMPACDLFLHSSPLPAFVVQPDRPHQYSLGRSTDFAYPLFGQTSWNAFLTISMSHWGVGGEVLW